MAILSPDSILQTYLLFAWLVWSRRIVWLIRFAKANPPLMPVASALPLNPRISVVIPARDEEKNIRNCLIHLLDQTYPNYEIIVVDDRSTDRTPQILSQLQEGSKIPIRSVRVDKLPPDWTGKNYAMFAGSRIASGEWVLFTDADTTHRPESLSTAMACALEKSVDFLTLAPETESRSFWERTVQPLASSSLAIWFKPEKINDPNNDLVLANGQFILVRKASYEKLGGNESVRKEVVEDVALAKRFKAAGLRVAFLNGIHLYSTRMYTSLKEIRSGWKRILIYLFNKRTLPLLHKAFLFLAFSILPYAIHLAELVLKTRGSPSFSSTTLCLSALLCVLISALRFVGNKMVKSNPWYGILHPLGSLVMVWILLCSVGRIAMKKSSTWRGDRYR